ncbi:uncharacterized protein C18orf63-like [Colias croceus]|uniref:uncharacterized protein C18orf63-like n=1 Tax=Colias crocea TaxID=72248 RepID=UPI001E27CBCF|nr:uncharacterized protein C18orf63-like [Colias croceus]
MDKYYNIRILNSNYKSLGYVTATANIKDKHDRSAPSDFHWKILKCRMIIFSHSSVIASPDKSDIKKVHIIFPRRGEDYDLLNSLFLRFSLVQEGDIRNVDDEIYKTCFYYTMGAKIAPLWNMLGHNYFINNRSFLTTSGPQEGIKCILTINANVLNLELKPVKINLMRSKEKFFPGEWIRVLPSLNKAIVEEYYENVPKIGDFKSYKDLRRHWKNIHGYRLPEEERPCYSVRFWRGDPLTYPDVCLVRAFPIITPMPKSSERSILAQFVNCLKTKMQFILGTSINFINNQDEGNVEMQFMETQAVSLCTPTQQKTNKM